MRQSVKEYMRKLQLVTWAASLDLASAERNLEVTLAAGGLVFLAEEEAEEGLAGKRAASAGEGMFS